MAFEITLCGFSLLMAVASRLSTNLSMTSLWIPMNLLAWITHPEKKKWMKMYAPHRQCLTAREFQGRVLLVGTIDDGFVG